MNRKNYFWGIVLIIIGIIGILDKGFNIDISSYEIWKYSVLLIVGIVFELAYFLGNNVGPGVLVPGGIFITLGIIRVFEYFTNNICSVDFGAFVLLGVAIGLFQLYWFGGKNRGLLVPIAILLIIWITSILSRIFVWINRGLVFPVLFVFLGIYIIYNNKVKS